MNTTLYLRIESTLWFDLQTGRLGTFTTGNFYLIILNTGPGFNPRILNRQSGIWEGQQIIQGGIKKIKHSKYWRRREKIYFYDKIVKSSNNGCLRKIRLIEDNAKYRHLKILTCKGTSRQVFICLRPRTAYTLGHTGKWGEAVRVNQREG